MGSPGGRMPGMARAAGASAFPVGTHCGVFRVFVAAATGVPTVAVRRLGRGLNLLRPACRCGRVPDLVHSSWAPYKDARGRVSEGVCYEPGIPRGSRRRLALFWSPRPSSRTRPRGRGTDPDRCRDSVCPWEHVRDTNARGRGGLRVPCLDPYWFRGGGQAGGAAEGALSRDKRFHAASN